jgi:hypothetical protein
MAIAKIEILANFIALIAPLRDASPYRRLCAQPPFIAKTIAG